MSKEKNNELCEDKQEARQLTEEELEQVTGGCNIPKKDLL